jgi:hypothetical protein
MKPYLLVYLMLCFSCSSFSPKEDPPQKNLKPENYVWQKIFDSAAWRKSYNYQLFSRNDTLWTFHPDANWYSIDDGHHWMPSSLPNVINNHAFLDYVLFKGAIYGLGNFAGNIERYIYKPTIYRTTNMRTWETLAEGSNLPNRFFYHPFVFKDKLWIIGGEDQQQQYADIWNSDDGIHWVKQKDQLDFGKRSNSLIVQLHNKLFLLNNDVWSSVDGIHWTKETDEIVKGEQIFGYAAVVYDDKIWLLGCNRNGQFSSQVLVSSDGKDWQGMNAPWSPRGGIAATVHHNRIFMTGGKYGGTPDHTEFVYSNDLWTFSKELKKDN